jgi:hypothetical protein
MNSPCVKRSEKAAHSRRLLESAVFFSLGWATMVSLLCTGTANPIDPEPARQLRPLFATVYLYRILQLEDFLFCPFARPANHFILRCLCVRPGTSATIPSQLLPLCACTAFFSLRSSPSVHLPVRPAVMAILGSKAQRHLL